MRYIEKVLALTAVSVILCISAAAQTEAPAKTPDVPYVPTSPQVVEAMLKLAEVKKSDVVYDLGSGDGRIVIAAAKKYGARGVGIDIDPALVEKATNNAKEEKVADKVEFHVGDIFETDFSKATVVTLYLLPQINLKLRPILWEQLKPGTRVVSHSFNMGDWEPEKTETVNGSTIYFWRIPEKAADSKTAIEN